MNLEEQLEHVHFKAKYFNEVPEDIPEFIQDIKTKVEDIECQAETDKEVAECEAAQERDQIWMDERDKAIDNINDKVTTSLNCIENLVNDLDHDYKDRGDANLIKTLDSIKEFCGDIKKDIEGFEIEI